MSKNKPLLSDEQIDTVCEVHPYHAQLYAKRTAIAICAIYEANITKDRELIQTLVGELIQSRASILGWIPDELTPMAHQMKIALKRINSALTLAGEQGHKPTEK